MDIKMLPKKFLIIILVLLIVILGVGVWLGIKFFSSSNLDGPSEYAAVYLKTGDIYFGKLSFFPWPRLKNVWFLQRTLDSQNQPQLGILPLKNVFWGPVDKIYLNPQEIVFWTYLRKNSQLTEALRNPNILNQPTVPASTDLQTKNLQATSTNNGLKSTSTNE